MKHRNIRYTLRLIQDNILVSVRAPSGIVTAVDRLLDAASEALGDKAKYFTFRAHLAVRRWSAGAKAGTPVGNPTVHYQMDPRTELWAALEA